MRSPTLALLLILFSSCTGESQPAVPFNPEAFQYTASVAQRGSGKLPLHYTDLWIDDGNFERAWALVDGNPQTTWNPTYHWFNPPAELNIDLARFNASVTSVRIWDLHDKDFNTAVVLIPKGGGAEIPLGTFTGDGWEVWAEFAVPGGKPVAAERIVLRSPRGGPVWGHELEVIGEYGPFSAPVAKVEHRPLGQMLGVNAHWWTFLDNAKGPDEQMMKSRYEAFLSLKPTSLRLYGDAHRYLPSGPEAFAFNPLNGGWYEDNLFTRLKKDVPGLVVWPVVQGQFPHVKKTWEALGKSSALNFPASFNTPEGRQKPEAYRELGRAAFVFAARRGSNAAAPDYGVLPQEATWTGANAPLKGLKQPTIWEGGNEPDATWAGYDNYMRGSELAAMWSVMYDGHKGKFKDCGVKNADPGFRMSTSGLASFRTDIFKAVLAWSRKHRGLRPDGSVDVPFDIIQVHHYSYTGGANQHVEGVQAGLPPEASDMMRGVKELVEWAAVHCPQTEVWVGEWGIDVNPGSPMSATAFGGYSAEAVRGAWAVRTLLGFAAAGLDRAQWFRLFQDDESGKDKTQFASMSLLSDAGGGKIVRRTVGEYWAQLGRFSSFVWDSTLSQSPRVERFRSGDSTVLAVWSVEHITYPKGEKPVFTEVTGTYTPKITKAATVLRFSPNGNEMKGEPLKPGGSVKFGTVPVLITY